MIPIVPGTLVISDKLRDTQLRMEGWRRDQDPDPPYRRINVKGNDASADAFLDMVDFDLSDALRVILDALASDRGS